MRNLALDERQNLPSAAVIAERTGSADEANVGEMPQERIYVRRAAVRWPACRASHAHESLGLRPTRQRPLG
jgi:hypothetical protein